MADYDVVVGSSQTVIVSADNTAQVIVTAAESTPEVILESALPGIPGPAGATPVKGVDYVDGVDGYTPIKNIDYFDGADSTIPGPVGYTPVKNVDYFDGAASTIPGPAGYTPIKNIDYFDGADGAGLPAGGSTSQILTKTSATDYAYTWQTPVAGVTDHTLLSNIGTNTHAQIDTALTTKANDSAVMHKTGDETISGIKTFTSEVALQKAYALFVAKNTLVSQYAGAGFRIYNTAPSLLGAAGAEFYAGIGDAGATTTYLNVQAIDKNGSYMYDLYGINLVTKAVAYNGTIAAANLGGVNTGDQDLSGLKLADVVVTTTGATAASATARTNYTYFINGAHTLTMPTCVGNANRYTIKNTHTAQVTLAFTSGQTADGGGITLNPNASVDLTSNNTEWKIS